MNKIIGIYKITNPKNKVYIGQSIDICKRFIYYKRLACKSQLKLYSSFKKYGVERHKFEIIQQCKMEQLNELEKYYVELFQCFNTKYGLNLQSGGNYNRKVSEESKIKNRIAHIGKKASDETKMKMSKIHKGHKYNLGIKQTPEVIEKRISKIRGLKRSEETRKKMSIIAKSRKFSQETRAKISIAVRSREKRPCLEETKLKISAALTGKKRGPLSNEHKEKIRVAFLGEKNHFFGKKHTKETKDKIGKANKKCKVVS